MRSIHDLPLFLSSQQLAKATGERLVTVRRGITENCMPADKLVARSLALRAMRVGTLGLAACGV